jgi:arabinose-5-phosphate isomerase
MTLSSEEILSSARNCLRIEQEALQITSDNLGDSFINAIRLIEKAILAGNKLVFTGVGKNVPICMKLFGTFNSTGVPAAYLDPNQALHGDLGLCLEGDLCLLFSNSGETEDLLRLIPALKRLGVTTLAITPVGDSSLVLRPPASLPLQQGSLPAQPGPDIQHHRGAGLGRCPGHGLP